MFREMRRARQALPKPEAVAILEAASSGVLALSGDDGYPYAVPLSYVYADNKIYFHCAKAGHKLDAIRRSPKASFCVIAQDEVLPEQFTTAYRSVIAFGQIRVLEEEAEQRAAIEILMKKYSPQMPDSEHQAEISKFWQALCMLEMTVEHLTGKEGKELMLARNKQ